MAHRERYGKHPYMSRKKYAEDLYLEVIDMRVRNGRIECLSRWNKFNPDGSLVAFLIGVLFADVWISFIEWLAPLLI